MSSPNEIVRAAVDVETTGLTSGVHEIIQLSVTHFDADFEPTGVRFHAYIQALKPELADPKALEVNGLDLEELTKIAPTPAQARMSLINWKKEMFGEEAKIKPLGHNYAGFDKLFLEVFLNTWYQEIFHYHITDTNLIARFLKDVGILKSEKTSLTKLCEFFGISYVNAHDAYADSLLTLKVYKELIKLVKPA